MTELLQFTLFGLMLGCVYAIASMGLVLTYTVTGVFNFAHGAVGMIAAFGYYELRVNHDVPTPARPRPGRARARTDRGPGRRAAAAAVPGGRLRHVARGDGRAHRRAPRARAEGLPRGRGEERAATSSVIVASGCSTSRSPTTASRRSSSPSSSPSACASCSFGTALGARMRSVVDDPELARLNGVRSVAVARCSWMIGFGLAALAGVLFSAGTNLNAIVLTLLVLNAYGAAMVGRLTSLPMTFLGALLLGLCQELTNVSWLWPDGEVFLRVRLAIPGLFLVLAVLLVPSFRLSAGRIVGRDQPRVPTLRSSAVAGAALVVLILVAGSLGPVDPRTAPGPRSGDGNDRPVARGRHRSLRADLPDAVPVPRHRGLRRRQDLRWRQRPRACSPADSSPRWSASWSRSRRRGCAACTSR